MTNTQPQAALLSEAAKNALVTLDGIADTNPRDTADFETPAEWIAWAKSRARWAADALREPISREVYAERILKQMLREASEPQAEKKCGTCGFIGQEDPVKGCPKCGFDDMRDKLQAATPAEPAQAKWSNERCQYGVCDEEDVHDPKCTTWNTEPAQAVELPPLPEPVDELAQADGFNVIGTVGVYTADQMRAYARAALSGKGA